MLALTWIGAALAGGVLYSATDYAALDALSAQVHVAGRVAGATTTWVWPDLPAGRWSFAAVVPPDSAIAGLRYRHGDGDWVSAGATPSDQVSVEAGPDGELAELLVGEVFSTPLPLLTEPGTLTLELSWQQVLSARDETLSVVLPLDDAGLNPGEPRVDVTFDVVGLEDLVAADLAPTGDVAIAGTDAAASWSGTMGDADAVTLTWTEQPGAFGVQVLTYRPAQDPFTGALAGPGYGLVVLVPGPVDAGARVDQLFTLVLDVSDSMAGEKLDTAVAAGGRWLGELEETDRFNLIPYASQAWPFRATAPTASEGAVARGDAFLARQEAAGLSDPGEALTEALDLADDTLQQTGFLGCGGTRRGPEGDAPPVADNPIEAVHGGLSAAAYVVLLTDGEATAGETDPDALAQQVAQENTFGASLFALGIGPDADLGLLDRLARENRGEAALVEDSDGVADAVAALQERLQDPLLVQPVAVVAGAWDQAPRDLADLSGGHELLMAFRYDQPGETQVFLSGLRGPEDIDETYDVALPELDEALPVIARAWAQLRARDLDTAWLSGDTSVLTELTDLVETYGVASDVVTLAFEASDPESSGAGDAALAIADDSAGCGCSAVPVTLSWTLLVGLGAAVRRRRVRPTSQNRRR